MLPAVRKAGVSTIVMADGFSCKEQIQQDTPRHGLHLAQVMQMALHDRNGARHMYPEAEFVRKRTAARQRSMKRAGIMTSLVLAAGTLLLLSTRRTKWKLPVIF